MSLGTVLAAPSVVWLAPNSGVQFLDLGFKATGNRDVPGTWMFSDDKELDSPHLVGRGDDEPRGKVAYDIDLRRIVELFDRVWMPLPYFRRQTAGSYDRGPVNWARAYLAKLDQPDGDGFDHRLVIAFDTTLTEDLPDQAYLGPTQGDSQRGDEFHLAAGATEAEWFAGQGWVRDWCRKATVEMIKAEARRRGLRDPEVTPELLAERLEGPREDIARYLALLDLLSVLGLLPGIKFMDRVTEPRPTPIDVDLVLDLGNSRTCGLLVETHPDAQSADLTQAVKLNLRDLGRPDQVYGDPFDSRIEFNRAAFGYEDLSFLSGRADAFSWPTVTRVGEEAKRLAANRRGSEGATGMSSPKRYLWDDTQRQDGWRFNNPDARDQAVYATGAEFTTLVNDRGEPLHLLPREEEGVMDDRHFPAMRALYARTHLMTFALSEVFLQAMGMMNAPFHRLRRRNAELPRRLRRIVMTMPTGMPLAERQRLVKRAEAARDLVYLCAGLAEPETDPDALQALRPVNSDQPLPEIRIEWDEASATQAAFLYSRIAEAHGGDAQAYFQAMRSPLRSGSGPGSGAKEGLRIATLDVGGGTTDLAITAYHGEGQGAHVTLFPDPILREGISLAGDDILQQVIVEHVLDPLRAALRAEGFGDRADVIIDQLFGGDRGDMSVAEQMRRQRFTLQIGTPLALAMVAVYEQWDRLDGGPEPFGVTIEEALRGTQDNALIAELEAEISKLGGGLTFDLKAVRFPVHAPDLDRTARSVMGDVLKAFAELVRRHQVDLLILSGRPSRMPAIFDVIAESCALPPNRILPLHRFRVGTWYPFRDFEARIADPKTTAAVGAMVCLLGGSGRLRNFNYRSEKLSVSSTARYFGKLDQDNRLKADNVFYAEMNLDNPDYELPGTAFEFRGPMYLGTRQFKADWWPGTRLYALDYASAEAAAQLTGRTPLKIELKRASGREAKGVPDIFAISRIEDAEGRTVGRHLVRLWLQTIDKPEGFWLDTGVLVNR